MKFIHTYGIEKDACSQRFISVKSITDYKLESSSTPMGGPSALVYVICYSADDRNHILTPGVELHTKEDVANLSNYIIKMLHFIHESPDGSIIRAFNGELWELVVE